MKKVYLCGGIKDLSTLEATTWREKAKKELVTFECLDPMRRDFRDCQFESQNEIVMLDKNDIVNSDILLVNATKPSWGTAMEVLFAFQKYKIVVAFTGKPFHETSPWLVFHATKICNTMEDAISYIKKQM